MTSCKERKGRAGKCLYGHLLHDMLEILLCTVQWRHIAEILSLLFKKERLKRDSGYVRRVDMRIPSLVTVLTFSYLHDLR